MSIELSNSKRTYLGKTADGRDKWALDCSIGAIQFRETGGEWQDIDPSVEEADSEGFSVKFTQTPYLGRIGEDSHRRIYPDRTNLSYWIEFDKPYPSMGIPTRQDRWFYWNFTNAILGIRFDNASIKFGFRLKNASAPTSITIPFTTQGITREGRLLYHNSVLIGELRKPTATDANDEERDCEITFGTGEVTISLDTTGLTFPIDIDPSVDLQVGASSDDTFVFGNPALRANMTYFSLTVTHWRLSKYLNNFYGTSLRFQSVTIPQGATIADGTKLTVTATQDNSATPVNALIYGEDVDDAATFSDLANYKARTATSAEVDWDGIGAWIQNTEYDSPEIKTIIQEIVNRSGWVSGNDLVVFLDSKSTTTGARHAYSYDSTPSKATKLHIEYTAAPTTAYIDISTRFRTFVQVFKDVVSRLKISGLNFSDVASRYLLIAAGYKDIVTRLKIVIGTFGAQKFFTTLSDVFKDIAARFRLLIGNFTDATTRFRLYARAYQDIYTRFKLLGQTFTNVVTKFRLWGQLFTDVQSRFELELQNFVDIITRFRMIAKQYSDTVARFLLNVKIHRDILIRFKLLASPTATTQPATDIESTSATLWGKITDDGGAPCEARFRYRVKC